jgi:hypothetical protein
MRFMGLLIEKNSRNMVTRLKESRVVAVQFQGRYADKLTYVPVISGINISELGHAV